jgi:hypothetical protein
MRKHRRVLTAKFRELQRQVREFRARRETASPEIRELLDLLLEKDEQQLAHIRGIYFRPTVPAD